MIRAVPDRPLRIVSYNVRYFGHALKGIASTRGSKHRIAHGIAALEPAPDVVCLQEIETVSMRSRLAYRSATREETQLESFMREFERALAGRPSRPHYDAFYFRAHVNRLRNLPISTTGLAVLVNRGRLRVEAHNVESPEHITHHHVERFRDRKQARIAAHLRLLAPSGVSLHVFNTHLSLPTPFARRFWSERWRMGWGVNQLREARKLVGFVRRHAGDEPFVICGDFNSAPGSPVYRYLTERCGFASAQEQMGQLDPADPRAFATAGFLRVRMHLDHMFSGNGVRWLDLDGTFRFGDRRGPFRGLSDHVPLIGRFRCAHALPRAAGRVG